MAPDIFSMYIMRLRAVIVYITTCLSKVYARIIGTLFLCASLSGCIDTLSSDLYKRGETEDPKFSPVVDDERYDLARSLTQGGSMEPAIRMYQALAKDHPQDPLPYLELGRLFMEFHAVNEAEQAYIAAAKRGAVTEARIGRGLVFLSRNEGRLAIEMFYPIFISNPENVEVINGLGVAYDLLSDHERAQRFYLAALQKRINWKPAMGNLALSMALSGKYKEAIDILQRLNTSPLSTPRDRHNLAMVYALSGNLEEFKKLSSVDLGITQVLENTDFILQNVHTIPFDNSSVRRSYP